VECHLNVERLRAYPQIDDRPVVERHGDFVGSRKLSAGEPGFGCEDSIATFRKFAEAERAAGVRLHRPPRKGDTLIVGSRQGHGGVGRDLGVRRDDMTGDTPTVGVGR
jgi:hypothetical protein